MKIKIQKNNNIISIPNEPAFLEGITDDGSAYKYRFFYDANIKQALKNNSYFVKIKLLKNETLQNQVLSFTSAKNENELIDNLLLQKSLQKDLTRSKNLLLLFESNSDISKKIPNNFLKTNPVNSSYKTIISKVSDLNKKNNIKAVTEQNLAAFNNSFGISQKYFKNMSKELLLKNKIEPAIYFGTKSNTIISAKKSFDGTTNKNNKIIKNVILDDKIKLAKDNLLSTTNITNTKELQKDDYVSNVELISSEIISINEYFEIPITLLNDTDFVLQYELFNIKGLSQQILSVVINHKEKIEDLLIPIKAPKIIYSGIQKPGKNVFSVTQIDENCDKINIYKKTIKTDEINLDSKFNFLKSINITKDSGSQIINDLHSSVNPTIYRVVAVSKSGVLGFDFDSALIKQENKLLKLTKQKLYFSDTSLTFYYQIINNVINLFIENIPTEPIAIEIYRKDLTYFNKTSEKIGNTILLNNDENNIISIQDLTSKKDRIYEYFCKLIYKDGRTQIAKNNIILKNISVQTNIASITISDPIINDQDLDISFDLEKNINLNNLDIVKKLLTEQNIADEYVDEILNEKEKLQNLFTIQVLRTNLMSGEIEDFGIIDSLNFSDKKFGEKKNVKSLEVGIEYQYSIITHSIPAEVIFEKYTRDVTVNNKTYSLKPSKWLHPITLKDGNIITPTTFKSYHSESVYTVGKIVDIQYLKVNLKNILPSILNVKAKILSNKKILIKWKTSGNIDKIDHFIISLELLGARTIVGKSHNISNTNDFQFIDMLENNEHGAIKYSIMPIYFDYSQGTEVITNTIFI